MKLKFRRWRQRLFRNRPEDTLPHRITHQRTYIVPSKRGCAFLFALLLMLVASVNYALSLGYALSFLLTGLFAATLLRTYQNLAGLHILQCDAEDTFAGQAATFNVQLTNKKTQTRHGIRISSKDASSALNRVEAESSTLAKLELPTHTRGIKKLGRLTIQSDWPLGLWTCWSYLHTPLDALVFPQPEDQAPPLPTRIEHTEGEHRQTATQGDVSGLREYIPGDTIGSIAWKSAARGLGLQVRSYEQETGQSQAVLSLQHTGKIQLEEQLSRLCAWVLQAESTHTDYSLNLSSEQFDRNHGHEQQQRVLRALALYGLPP